MADYTRYSFEKEYDSESIDDRYNRLRKMFLEKSTKQYQQILCRVTTAKDYKEKLDRLKSSIDYFRTPELIKENPVHIYGYPTTEFLIELFARANECMDNPENTENNNQLMNLANQIPEHTSAHWRSIKTGIFICSYIAISIGLFVASLLFFGTPLAPLGFSAWFAAVGILLSAPFVIQTYLEAAELDAEVEVKAKEIKDFLGDNPARFFSLPPENPVLEPETQQNQESIRT